MKPQTHIATDDEHRVLKFKPRTSKTLIGDADIVAQDEPDDFSHRMWTNVAALVFTAALVGAGIWLAVSIADLRKSQDCVLMGRRGCARVSDRVLSQVPTDPAPAAIELVSPVRYTGNRLCIPDETVRADAPALSDFNS